MPWQGHIRNQKPHKELFVKLIEQKCTVVELLGNNKKLDPRRVLSIAVYGDIVHMQMLEFPTHVKEKMSISIPAPHIPAGATITTIKSIQMKNRLVVVEVNGPLNTAVKSVISAVADQMAAINMVTTFFPGNDTTKAPSQYYFGFGVKMLRAANPNIRNIRILENGQGVLFTQATQMKQVSINQINEDWIRSAEVVYESKKEISFLGRVQEGRVAITMSDETTFMATLTRTRATVTTLSTFRQKVSTVFGITKQGGVHFLAGTKGQEFILVQTAII